MTTNTAETPSSGGNVLVEFFTTTCPYVMPEHQTYAIPLTSTPSGLQLLVQSVLNVESLPLDFLVGEEYIGTSLERFLRRRGVNVEEVLRIEYTPAMQAQEGSKMPHDDWVSCVRAPVAGNAAFLLTTSYDRCVRVWESEACVGVAGKHSEAAIELAVRSVTDSDASPSSKTQGSKKRKKGSHPLVEFVSCGKDGSMVAWRSDSNGTIEELGTARPHLGAVDTVDVHASGNLVASGSWDGTVKVTEWSTVVDAGVPADRKAPLTSFTDHTRAVLSTRFSPRHASSLYSAGTDSSVKLWDVNASQLVSTVSADHPIQGIALKPVASGDLVLAACTDHRVRLVDARQKSVAKVYPGHRQWVYAVSWLWRPEEGDTSFANQFCSASEDATVRVWDIRSTTQALVQLDQHHTDGVLDVCYVGNGEIASAGKDNKTKTFTLSK